MSTIFKKYIQLIDMPEKEVRYPLLMYDGFCGFCDRMVQIVLRNDRGKKIYFLPRQSGLAQELRAANQIPENADSIVFLDLDSEGQIRPYLHSSAALKICGYLSGFWKIFLIGRIIPAPIRDWVYRLFARNRYRFYGRSDHCIMPTREFRSRFLESDWENPAQELK